MTIITALALSYALGIALSGIIKSFTLLYILTILIILIALALFKNKRGFEIILILLAFLLGCLSFKNVKTLSVWHISRFEYLNNKICLIKGLVAEKGLVKNNRYYIILNTQQLQCLPLSLACTGKVFIILRNEPSLYPAQNIIVKGRLNFLKLQSKKTGYGNYLSTKGIYVIMNTENCNPIIKLDNKNALSFNWLALKLKEKVNKIFSQDFSPLSSSILGAMILGEKKNVPQRIEKNMIRTGTIHILVVSGFNVGLIALIFSSLLKLLRVKKTLRFYFIVPLVIFYCLLTGASTPVLRATLMAVIFLAAIFLKREQNLQNSLFLSMFLILIINPAQLYDLGFQLSFVSVASIFYLYPKINHLVKRVSLNNRPLQLLVASLEVSLSAWLGTFPLIAYYFRLFSPITVIANILIVPLATLVIFSGISFLCIKLTLPFLSPWFKISTEAFILALLKVNQFMAELPGAYFYLK